MLIFAKRGNLSRTGSSIEVRGIENATENHKDDDVLHNNMRLILNDVKKARLPHSEEQTVVEQIQMFQTSCAPFIRAHCLFYHISDVFNSFFRRYYTFDNHVQKK